MAYLGNAPARSFISFERQVFTIVNSQTAYTLDHSVNNENDLRLVINNIVQEPGSGKAYTASGTTLTLSAALTNGTDEMYCVFLGRATATNAPGAGSVGTSQLASDAVTGAKIADDAISDEHLDPTAITGQTAETTIADDDLILISDTSASAALKKMTKANFVSGVGGTNTPMFYSYMSGNQTISTGVISKMQFSQEEYDIGSTFDTSNYRYTPGFTGKSFLIGSARWNSGGDWNNNFLYVYKNGSVIFTAKEVHSHYDIMRISVVVDHDDNDYFELYIEQQSGGVVDLYGGSGRKGETYFQGFKLIT